MIVTHRERERQRDIGRGRSRLHAPGADVGFDPGSPGSRPGPKAGAKPLRHPGIPPQLLFATFFSPSVCCLQKKQLKYYVFLNVTDYSIF